MKYHLKVEKDKEIENLKNKIKELESKLVATSTTS